MDKAVGRVITGFSCPYVGLYSEAGGKVSYANGRRLARGVSVTLDVEASDDNDFYADNVAAESDGGKFTKGSVKLTVDGLHDDAERMIYGMPEPQEVEFGANVKVSAMSYGDDVNAPYVGVGVIVEYTSGGITTYQPTIFPKCKFSMHGLDAKTREKQRSWQTQELTAALHRDDTSKHNWKYVFDEQATEADARAVLENVLSVAAQGAAE